MNILIKLFIKNYKDVNNPQVRQKYGNLASIFGIISNFFICVLKLVFGLLFNLISLIADGFNNLSDAGSSLVSLIGFKLSSKPADKDHPYGHARIEYIAGLAVSIIISILGVQLITNSISGIIDNFNKPFQKMEQIEFIITIVVLSISILVKIFQGLFYKKIGKRISSLALIATSTDSRNDVLATSFVLVGIIISQCCSFYIDGYLGCIVGIFILISGFKLIKETSNPLIGEKVDDELVKKLVHKILSYDGVLGIHDLQIHNYGPKTYYASIHVEVDASKDILSTHDMIDNIEKEILHEFNIIITIHMDPVVLNDPFTDKVRNQIIPILKALPYVNNVHDFRVIKGPTHTNIVFDVAVCLDTKLKDDKIENNIKQIIKDIDNTYNAIITIDHDYEEYIEGSEEELKNKPNKNPD